MNQDYLSLWGIHKHLREEDFRNFISDKAKKELENLINVFPNWNPKGIFFVSKEVPIEKIICNFLKEIYEKKEIHRSILFMDFSTFFSSNNFRLYIDEEKISQKTRIISSDIVVFVNVGVYKLFPPEMKEFCEVLTSLIGKNKPFILMSRNKDAKDNIGLGLWDMIRQNCKMLTILKRS